MHIVQKNNTFESNVSNASFVSIVVSSSSTNESKLPICQSLGIIVSPLRNHGDAIQYRVCTSVCDVFHDTMEHITLSMTGSDLSRT